MSSSQPSFSLPEKLLIIEKGLQNNMQMEENVLNLIENSTLCNYTYNINENKNIEMKTKNFLLEKELLELNSKILNIHPNLSKKLNKDYNILKNIIDEKEENENEEKKKKYNKKCSYYFYDEFVK